MQEPLQPRRPQEPLHATAGVSTCGSHWQGLYLQCISSVESVPVTFTGVESSSYAVIRAIDLQICSRRSPFSHGSDSSDTIKPPVLVQACKWSLQQQLEWKDTTVFASGFSSHVQSHHSIRAYNSASSPRLIHHLLTPLLIPSS